MEIQTIFFDWVGVLLEKRKILDPKSKELSEYICRNWRGHTSKNDAISYLKITENKLDDLLNSYVSNNFTKYKPIWDLLPILAEKYNLAVINNGPKITKPYFDEVFGFSKYGLFINSEEEGLWKPDPDFFELALQKINAKKENSTFMDDAELTESLTKKTGIYSFRWKTHNEGFNTLLNLLKLNGYDRNV